MKAYEFSTKITPDGKLELPEYLKNLPGSSEVRVIVLVEEIDQTIAAPESERISVGFSSGSFRTSWEQAIRGETIPISQMWEGINVD